MIGATYRLMDSGQKREYPFDASTSLAKKNKLV